MLQSYLLRSIKGICLLKLFVCDDCYKGIVGKICQALEVMAWGGGNTLGYCEALLCNVKFYYIGFALDILGRF